MKARLPTAADVLPRRTPVDAGRMPLRTTLVLNSAVHAHGVPITTGICLPEGAAFAPDQVQLLDATANPVDLQQTVLARWHDGSLKWVLLDFVADSVAAGEAIWTLVVDRAARGVDPAKPSLVLESSSRSARVNSGPVTLELQQGRLRIRHRDTPGDYSVRFVLKRHNGRLLEPQIRKVEYEARGPVRVTFRIEGHFRGCRRIRFVARLSVYAGTGLVRVSVRLHNANRARHRGGLWDLGDPGSFFFKSFALEIDAERQDGDVPVIWQNEPSGPVQSSRSGRIEVYQDSSGGENWRSRNHMNCDGRVPCRFRGYQSRSPQGTDHGLRASPTVAIGAGAGSLCAAIPEFWQQFPKSLEAITDGATVRVGLFPEQWDDLFELQGGEQKTHDVWLNVSGSPELSVDSLNWVHSPVRPLLTPAWYAHCQVFSCFTPAADAADDRLRKILTPALTGENSLFARRETIDEYGWRNFGDLWADHEEAYYSGPRPVISHYNNQFDVIYGAVLQSARTGDANWLELADPLARHVIDIDIYHTECDRAAYNGGLFWHTDHYRDAGTCTHRTYSRANQPAGIPYGGGPSNEHNYTTGLLFYYYLTGNPDARDAVLSLADWAVKMDDGRETPLFVLDAGPTGLASSTTEPSYHGPGRGAGNSVNALLDGWQVSADASYLRHAERLIRRVIHPGDEIDSHQLLNVELRWSYTVFLSAILRFLELKESTRQLDEAYAYAVASVERYAVWMAEHERPYFDRPQELEYPTETWAAQELRKANVLRLSARYVQDAHLRARVQARGDELAERAWSDLAAFESRGVTRSVALLFTEGSRDACLRSQSMVDVAAPAVQPNAGFPPRAPFVSQKERVRAQLRSISALPRATAALLWPPVWPRLIRNILRTLS